MSKYPASLQRGSLTQRDESSEYHGVQINLREVADMAALEAVKKMRESSSKPR